VLNKQRANILSRPFENIIFFNKFRADGIFLGEKCTSEGRHEGTESVKKIIGGLKDDVKNLLNGSADEEIKF